MTTIAVNLASWINLTLIETKKGLVTLDEKKEKSKEMEMPKNGANTNKKNLWTTTETSCIF